MKHLLLAVSLTVSIPAMAKDVYVDGYTRNDGTYVAPHHRSAPAHSQQNNYGTQGNYNPYTGAQGTVQPQPTYQQPSSQSPAYQHPSQQQPCYGYGCR